MKYIITSLIVTIGLSACTPTASTKVDLSEGVCCKSTYSFNDGNRPPLEYVAPQLTGSNTR